MLRTQLESLYRSVSVVSNICVHADPQRAKPFAIVVVNEPVLRQLLDKIPGSECSLSTLTQDAEAQRVVLNQLQLYAKQQALPSIEKLEAVAISPLSEWGPQNVSALLEDAPVYEIC